MMLAMLRARWLAVGLLGIALLACRPETGSDGVSRSVTVYSGRSEKLIDPLLQQFKLDTGIEVDVRYADTSELTATIMEEGANTPAEVFIAQDAGALGALSHAGLLQSLPPDVVDRIPARFRSPLDDWVGLSGRARVVVYNTERITPEELPQSLADTHEARYEGRFGVAPTNASFQAHMAAFMALNGEQALRELLRGMAANKPRIYAKNSPIVEAVIAGEIDWGLVNHYYLMRALKEDPTAPAKNFLMPASDGSAFVNVAGGALLRNSPNALELLRFLVSDSAQRYFAEETFEYPLVEGHPAAAELATRRPDEPPLDYGAVSEALDATLTQIQQSGLTRFQ